MSILTSFRDIVYSATSDGDLKRSERISPDISQYEFKKSLKLSAAPMVVSAGEHEVYVLMNNNKIARIDANSHNVTQE